MNTGFQVCHILGMHPRLWKALKDEAITLITGALYWKPAQRKAAVDVLKERPRKRKLQTLPQPVAKLVANFS